ncbi:hypothetical protein O0Q50_23685 [Priestia aryabhattai]|uniref:Uncharacterized protein n=1 Tax=Priestia aryabhattai TaxID=412384 RepID=A0AAX6NE51_PRIAR|nr:hypothetical protein [Priestia aryabhattai]MDU9694191.1 hypothetical protein [Priestia aryabhattai]
MKQAARDSFIKQLTQACDKEGIEIDILSLPDKELKELYLKLQTVRSHRCAYGIGKGKDFQVAMKEKKLQTISFSDTYKYGVRPLTFKEYLMLCEYAEKNPGQYGTLRK